MGHYTSVAMTLSFYDVPDGDEHGSLIRCLSHARTELQASARS